MTYGAVMAAPSPRTRPAVTRATSRSAPAGPVTLAIDIGGTGLKASVLSVDGSMLVDRVRRPTTYPLPPEKLVADLAELVGPLPRFDRVAAGFPGMVRGGRVLSAPHFVTVAGPGTRISNDLGAKWDNVDLAGMLSSALGGLPTKVANDADVQGAAVISGRGLELVVTLGTGVGTGLFMNGTLAPHLELGHHPFQKDRSYDERLGEAARQAVGPKRWNRRVKAAVATLDALLFFDHVYIGGGNSHRVKADLGPKATIVDNSAGLLGGIRLWERAID